MGRGDLSFKEVIWVSRPAWWLVTGALFFSGSWLASGEISFSIIVGTLYFLLPYNLLIHGLNDIFDYEHDLNNDRKRILPRIKLEQLRRWIGATNGPFLIALLLLGNVQSNAILLMMIFLAIAYSAPGLRYKGIPFIDSITAGFYYSSPFLFALFLMDSPNLWASVFAAVYFGLAGLHAFGSIKDIRADREAKCKTTGVYLGSKKTLFLVLIAFLLAVLSPILAYRLQGLIVLTAIAPYFLVVFKTLPHRANEQSPVFRFAWQQLLRMNQVVFLTGLLSVIYLYNR